MKVYTVNYPLPDIKIAFLSDLHNENLLSIVDTIKEENVDYICIAGDVLERADHGKDPRDGKRSTGALIAHILHLILRFFFRKNLNKDDTNTFQLLTSLSQISTLIISRGNHEWYYKESDLKFFKEHHITLLDNTYQKINGIVFGGLSSDYDLKMIDAFEKEDGYKILLCHHPEYYPLIKDKKIDLILSGHAHGGQIQIKNKGLYAPGQGLFPKYTFGIYGNMLVSNGLSNTFKIPRINNEESFFIIENKGAQYDKVNQTESRFIING